MCIPVCPFFPHTFTFSICSCFPLPVMCHFHCPSFRPINTPVSHSLVIAPALKHALSAVWITGWFYVYWLNSITFFVSYLGFVCLAPLISQLWSCAPSFPTWLLVHIFGLSLRFLISRGPCLMSWLRYFTDCFPQLSTLISASWPCPIYAAVIFLHFDSSPFAPLHDRIIQPAKLIQQILTALSEQKLLSTRQAFADFMIWLRQLQLSSIQDGDFKMHQKPRLPAPSPMKGIQTHVASSSPSACWSLICRLPPSA